MGETIAANTYDDVAVGRSAPLSLKRATLLLSLLGGFRLVVGLVYSVLVAMAFGAMPQMDAYNVGTYVPTVLMGLCGLEIMRGFLVTLFSRLDVTRQEDPVAALSSVLTLGCMLALVMVAGGMVWAPRLVGVIAPGVDQATSLLAVKITRLIMPGLAFMTLGAFSSAVLLAHHAYAKSQAFDIISKMIVALGALICVFIPNMYILASAFVTGQVVAALVALRLLAGAGLRYRLGLRFTPVVRTLVAQSVPLWIGMVLMYAAATVQRRYASAFSAGSIASLGYALTIFSAVTMLISVPLFRAFSPRVARLAAAGRREEEAQLFWTCFRQGNCAALIMTVLLCVLSRPVIVVAFHRGAFDAQAVETTSTLFTWIAIGVWGNIVSYLAIATMFAHKASYMVMLLDTTTSLATCLLVVLTVDRYGVEAIGIASGVSHMVRGAVACLLVIHLLERRFCGMGGWLVRFACSGAASIAALKASLSILPIAATGFWPCLASVAMGGLALGGGFAVGGYWARLPEVRDAAKYAKATISRRLARRQTGNGRPGS